MMKRIPDEMAKRWATYTDGDTHNNAMPVENIVSMAQEIITSRELLEKQNALLERLWELHGLCPHLFCHQILPELDAWKMSVVKDGIPASKEVNK